MSPGHPNEELIGHLFRCLEKKEAAAMAECYAEDAYFEDIAFRRDGRKEIYEMWSFVCSNRTLKVRVSNVRADTKSGSADVVDEYDFKKSGRHVVNEIQSAFVFRDGKIVEQRDNCNALQWGIQALGPVKGALSWVIPGMRRKVAKEALEEFLLSHARG